MEQISMFDREKKNHVIFFSGGKSSFTTAHWVKENYPNDNILLYFQDVMWEDEDLYRFIYEAAEKLQLPMLIHSAGLSPIEFMFEKKLVLNSMIGDCSKYLKMKVASDFIKKGIEPPVVKWFNKEFLKDENFRDDPILYLGIGWDEAHREKSIRENWAPYRVSLPLMDHFLDNEEVLAQYGLNQSRLYDFGFSHNNCGGRCVKAGIAHYQLLKKTMPERFQKIMEQEHYLKLCVSSYRYITEEDTDDPLPKHVQERMLQELDDAYRDYFYGRAEKPKLFVHPCVSASRPKDFNMVQYSFLKKSYDGISIPYPLRELKIDVDGKPFDDYSYPSLYTKEWIAEEKARRLAKKQGNVIECSVEEDVFGGCGCFVDYDEPVHTEELTLF